jgi:hypothetical protein
MMIRRQVMAITLLAAVFLGANIVHAASTLTGTWSGSIQILAPIFQSPYFVVTGGSDPGPTDVVTIQDPITTIQTVRLNLPNGAVLVDAETLPATLNFNVIRTAITGSVASTNGALGTIDGAVVIANKFFLLHISVDEPNPGPCGTGEYQVTASIVPRNPNRLIFTGSGLDSQCEHNNISGQFSRQ